MSVKVQIQITGGFALASLLAGVGLYVLDDMEITQNTKSLGLLLIFGGFGLVLLAIYLATVRKGR